MSLDVFVRKCGNWGLLPNNPAALAAYRDMKVMGQMCAGPGFSRMLKALCMPIPDLGDIGSLEQLKGMGVAARLNVVLTCHEILHNLHFALHLDSFKARSVKKVADWDNEEEMLTIAGETGTVPLPGVIMVSCNPKLFNEHSLCRILKLSNRADHHSRPSDVASSEVVDFSALPTGVPWWSELEAETD
jgi:hypothetical protein